MYLEAMIINIQHFGWNFVTSLVWGNLIAHINVALVIPSLKLSFMFVCVNKLLLFQVFGGHMKAQWPKVKALLHILIGHQNVVG